MSEILRLKNVVMERNGQQRILSIDSFSLRRGELTAVVGPNGAGKSTLLQTINLLQKYDGEIDLFGEKANSANSISLRRRCSMVFQDVLLVNGTVFDNVAWPLRFRSVAEKEIKARVHKALVDFGCNHLADRPAKNLSGGEAQRICLARALVTEPELLLMDEPFSSLDVAMSNVLMEEIRAVARQREITVLLVSHNFSDVLYFAERVVALFEGQILQDDRPEVLLRRPIDERVARLVGMDNVLPCQIEQIEGGQLVTLPGGIQFTSRTSNMRSAGICCLPGDAFAILEDQVEEAAGRVVIEGLIERVLPGIGTRRVLVSCRDLLLSTRLPRQVNEKLQAGDRIRLVFDPLEAHIIGESYG